MLLIKQGTSSRFPGYDGPVVQADEIDVTVPALVSNNPTSVSFPIGAQHIPVGGVVSADFANVGDVPDTLILRRTNDTPGQIDVILYSFSGVIDPVQTRLHYSLTSHDIPKTPQFPVGT